MILEKFEYPTTAATATYSWLMLENPHYDTYEDPLDLGVVTDISAGSKMYAYGAALWTVIHRRTWSLLTAADRGGFENFLKLVGANKFRYTDYRGVPHQVSFGDYKPVFKLVGENLWNVDCLLREELPVTALNMGKAAKFIEDLLFYAPLKADLECFNRWDITKTYVNTNPFTLRTYPLLTEATPAGPQLDATAGIIKARGERITYASGWPITYAPNKGTLFFIQKGEDAVARSYAVTYDGDVPEAKSYENAVLMDTRVTNVVPDTPDGDLFENVSSVNLRLRDVMTFGRVLTAAELLDVHNTMI